MKNSWKLFILNLSIVMVFLVGCGKTPPINYKIADAGNMSIEEARNILKSTIIKDSSYDDIQISDTDIKLYFSKTEFRKIYFQDMTGPELAYDNDVGAYAVDIGKEYRDIYIRGEIPAKRFTAALAYLKQHAGQGVKQEKARGAEDCLHQVHNTSIDLILAGATATDLNLSCSGVSQDQIEATLNDTLVEWKSKGLRVLLQKSSAAQLNDLVVKMEKGLLKLDLKAKELKDAADEDARQVKAPGTEAPAKQAPGASKLSHLLDQRKTLLMVILGSVKQVAARP